MKIGYIRLTLADGSRVLEHRHVWEEAYGPIPPGAQIHHRNRDRTDNRLENLQLMIDEETHKKAHRGTSHHFKRGSKLTREQAQEIKSRWTGKYGEMPILAREFGVSVHHIDRIVHGWNWKD